MAAIGTLIEPATIDTVEQFQPLPIGPLIDVAPITSVSGASAPVANRFPVAPSAFAFLTGVDSLLDEPIVISGLMSPYFIVGAVYPQSDYLEPTLGQIWPRTG
jgi:hypothetical protein